MITELQQENVDLKARVIELELELKKAHDAILEYQCPKCAELEVTLGNVTKVAQSLVRTTGDQLQLEFAKLGKEKFDEWFRTSIRGAT